MTVREGGGIVRRVVFCLAVIAAAMLVGCGGGGDEEAVEPTAETAVEVPASSLDREELIDRGDAICAEVNAAVAALEMTGTSPAVQLGQRVDLYEGMMESLRSLDGEDPELTAVFATGRDIVQAAAEAETAAQEGDAMAVAAAEARLDTALSEFQQASLEFGFSDCGGEAVLPEPVGEIDQGGAGDSESVPDAGSEGGVDQTDTDIDAPPVDTGGAPADGGQTPEGGGADPGGGAAPADPGAGGDGQGGSTGGFSPGG